MRHWCACNSNSLPSPLDDNVKTLPLAVAAEGPPGSTRLEIVALDSVRFKFLELPSKFLLISTLLEATQHHPR